MSQFNKDRRNLIKLLGMMKVVPPIQLLSMLSQSGIANAATGKKYLITIRSIFDFRNKAATNFTAGLAPLAAHQDKMAVITGLGSNAKGDGYHMGKQKRFATSCTPLTRTTTTAGGGAWDGQSFDLVVGNHLKTTQNTKQGSLILGAYPYQSTSVQPAFSSISFENKNQFIIPTYDYDTVLNDIKQNSNLCNEARVKHDVNLLKSENMVLENMIREYEYLQGRADKDTKVQLQGIQGKIVEKLEQSKKIITNGGFAEGDCVEVSKTPQPYNSYGGSYSTIPTYFDEHTRKLNYTASTALASGYVGSVTLNYNFTGHSQNNVPGFHGFTHNIGLSGNAAYAALDELSNFQMHMLNHLISELKAAKILDETLIVYSTHERPVHNHADVPILVYGASSPGVYSLAGKGLYIHDVAADILNVFGVPNANNFGGEKSKGGIFS